MTVKELKEKIKDMPDNMDVFVSQNDDLTFSVETYHSEYTVSEYSTKIKYVHQLQNLYFALTGEEL